MLCQTISEGVEAQSEAEKQKGRVKCKKKKKIQIITLLVLLFLVGIVDIHGLGHNLRRQWCDFKDTQDENCRH